MTRKCGAYIYYLSNNVLYCQQINYMQMYDTSFPTCIYVYVHTHMSHIHVHVYALEVYIMCDFEVSRRDWCYNNCIKYHSFIYCHNLMYSSYTPGKAPGVYLFLARSFLTSFRMCTHPLECFSNANLPVPS